MPLLHKHLIRCRQPYKQSLEFECLETDPSMQNPTMYKLTFYFFYRYFLWRNDDSPKFGAICGLFLTIGLQIILLFVLIREWTGHELVQPFSQNYGTNKLLNMLFVIPFLFLFFKYINGKRTDEIVSMYDKRTNVFNVINCIVFIVAAVLPLVLIIVILKR